MRRILSRSALLITALVIIVSFIFVSPASAKEIIHVFYAGPQGGVYNALRLSSSFELVSDPSQADVLVLNGVIPDAASLRARYQSGAGLVLFLGPQIATGDLETLLGFQVSITTSNQPTSLVQAKGASHPIFKEILWNSAPQVRERAALAFPLSSPIPLITSYENGDWILWELASNNREAFIFNAFLDGSNSAFQEWAYFNYFVYDVTTRAAGGAPLSFADYEGSPVPHLRQQIILIVFLVGLLVLSGVLFWLVRKYSLAHPEALDTLVVDRQEFESRQAGTEWDAVGFHRPLGGFLLPLMLGLVLFIPLIIYQNLILPQFILPSAQALGIWGRVTQFFNFLWLFLDMGTSAAFIKFFAQYRVHEPRKAIQYAQIYVWWQALSGAVQVALVVALAGSILPRTAYALYTWSVIVHTFIQIPGFYTVMKNALYSWQRFDYAQVIEMGTAIFFPMLAQPLLVSLMVLWGRHNPVFGTAMGGLIGLGFAAYASEALAFFMGLWLYGRLGYNVKVLFLAHFTWDSIKEAFRFGVFEMLGSFAWAVGQALEILITQNKLVNYTEVWGNWGLAQNFVFAFNAVGTLYNNLMPSISEAVSNARIKLSQYYSAMAYKWGGLISAFIGAVLLAVADRFILGASGPEFKRAALYAVPLIIWGTIQYPSWVGDNVQRASNHPRLIALLVTMEQTIRVLLALLLVGRFQINALIIAYFVGLLTKDFVGYFINHKLCFPQRFYVWQSLVAPLLAGGAHFLVLRWVTGLVWKGDMITSVLIFLIGILFSFPLFAFFYGLFGGWDDHTLAELHKATALANFMRPMAWLFWAANALGAKISPLHGRFAIDIYPDAVKEAEQLTQERVTV